MVYIIAFDFCNLGSIGRYFINSRCEYGFLDNDSKLVVGRDAILIPGVGSFGHGMAELMGDRLDEVIRYFAASGGTVVGICLGMQLMFDSSEESPGVQGLGLIAGDVALLPNEGASVPRIGWDTVYVRKSTVSYSRQKRIYQDTNLSMVSSDFYFVHSYHCVPRDEKSSSAYFKHGGELFCASVEKNNIFGLQFHPEKSGPAGYGVLDAIFISS